MSESPARAPSKAHYARLPEKVMQRNRLMGIFEGGTARVIFSLTTGAFLVGFLKHMGADDTICGYILSIPILAAAIQFLAPIVLERLEFRLRIILLGNGLHRLLLSLMILIPFLPLPSAIKLWITAGIYLLSNLSVSFVTPAAANLYVSFVEPQNRGKYFGNRESWLLVFATVMNLVLGKALDLFRDAGNERGGFLVIYGTIFLLTLLNAWCFFQMREVPLGHSPEPMKIREVFTLPLKSRRFLRFFVLSVLWNLSFQFSAAFFGIYQVNELALTYTEINLYGMLSNVTYFLCAQWWGRIADRKGWSFTTRISFLFLGITCVMWFFIVKGSLLAPLMSMAMLLSGIAWSGLNVSMFNLQFDFMPEERRTVYIGFNSTVSGLLGYAASLAGAMLVGAASPFRTTLLGIPVGIKQLLFLASGLLICGCAFYIHLFMQQKQNGAHTPETKGSTPTT